MAHKYVLALDQGTTSSRAILFDHAGKARGIASKEFRQIYPQPGWVEHDPMEIWETQLEVARRVLDENGVKPEDIAGIGITNQRETTVLWERSTGRPLANAIVWQCRRTAEYCDALKADGLEGEVRKRTGLVIDAYFSGTKVKWLLDSIPGARDRAAKGELCFGTIDSWLLFKLTGRHATDYSNASRTMLFNIAERMWDAFMLETLDVPSEILPEVCPTSHVYGITTALGGEIPVAALCGDQQSALFGQTAFQAGECKNTYGTGCFLLMNTGEAPVASSHGLLTTIAWGIGDRLVYALEGSVFIGGAVIQWLRDELRLISSAEETEKIAASVENSNGAFIVPAFVGLGAPHWAPHARGTITGLTRGVNRAHLVRAALESIANQSADVITTMEKETSRRIPLLKVDGGAARNDVLLQHQADVLGIPIIRGETTETTALGAAMLAGLATGFWKTQEELSRQWVAGAEFNPKWDRSQRENYLQKWNQAIKTTITA